MSRYEPERRRPTPIGALAWVAGIALLAAVVLFVGKQLVLWSNAAPPTATPAPRRISPRTGKWCAKSGD